MSTATSAVDELHGEFRRRLEQTLQTVHAWDSPHSCQTTIPQIRASLPWDDLRNDHGGPYAEPHRDAFLPGGAQGRFVQRLARYFQRNVMTWVNAPNCSNATCVNNNSSNNSSSNNSESRMEHVETRGPLSQHELQGQASRVEVWRCLDCSVETCFPRFNACSALLDSKRGRCGEYANLFGLYCRAVGLETRYVLDWTDHVWTEVKLYNDDNTGNNNGVADGGWWCMVDSCEGVMGEPSMYEAGWGKALTLMVAIGTHHVMDVTARYTRKFTTVEMQQRRRQGATSSEAMLHEIIRELNHKLQNTDTLTSSLAPEVRTLTAKARQTLQLQCRQEEDELRILSTLTSWQSASSHGKGRISGSAEWKEARNEAGNAVAAATTDDNHKETSTSNNSLGWQPFWSPSTNNNDATSITIDPWAVDARYWIRMNQTIPCCCNTGPPFVLGQQHERPAVFVAVFFLAGTVQQLQCGLWHSQRFETQHDLASFVATLPVHAIVALTGQLPLTEKKSSTSSGALQRLGGFDAQLLYPSPQAKDDDEDHSKKSFENHNDWIVYLGQVDAHPPTWTRCSRASDCRNGYEIGSSTINSSQDDDDALCLTTFSQTRAHSICGRLESTGSSLAEQQSAFWQARQEDPTLVGFTTTPIDGGSNSSVVHLLGETAHPLVSHGHAQNIDDKSSWTTCLVLPKPVVPPDQRVASSILEGRSQKNNDTAATATLQYQVPLDLDFFHNQIGTQLVLPGAGSIVSPTASVLENVRLVGLYFSASWCGPCRQFTPLLCEAYETWKDSNPTHGLEIVFVSSDRDPHSFSHYHNKMPWPAIGFDALPQFKQQLSMIYGVRGIPSLVILDAVSGQVVVNASASRNELVQATRQGEVGLERLLSEWLNRVPAATIELLSMLEVSCQDSAVAPENGDDEKEKSEDPSPYWNKDNSTQGQQLKDSKGDLPAGPFADTFHVSPNPSSRLDKQLWEQACLQRISKSDMKPLLDTLIKYVANCRKSPWVVKYRHFRVSNKVVDRGITRIPHALTLLQTWGLEVSLEGDDYAISIPVSLNLEELSEDLQVYQEEYC
mmetsp:Transcript_3747/g.10330  ORF Transcript_3747/g.10330 Transcript_3747/m.10330 type:complete len:1064 (-) Transcript_3747:178-3369(-)